jgi:hypothetical protein
MTVTKTKGAEILITLKTRSGLSEWYSMPPR